jgi:D-alanine-D-alanine ligase
MNKGERVILLYDVAAADASSPDQGDAIVQAEAVKKGLKDLGFQCREFAVSMNLEALTRVMEGENPAFAFNLVESLDGKGRFISFAPLVLDSMGIPYTGSPADAIYLTSHKLIAKKILHAAGIATPLWFTLEDLIKGATPETGFYIIKSVWEHASIGLDEDSIVDGGECGIIASEIRRRRSSLGGEGFSEKFIEGREFNLSLLAGPSGPQVLPPAQIIFKDYPEAKPKVVGYRAKWDQASFEYLNTPRTFDFPASDGPLLGRLKSAALACWHIFGLRGYARVDFRVDRDGVPWVLEINTNPCLSPDAGFMAAAQEAGLGIKSVLERIIGDIGWRQ